jgi:RNA polymerase sigma factor (TIGR02999 family)
MKDGSEAITQALASAGDDAQARERAFALVYDDLLRIARAELARHRRGQTLNTRALVHETYLKLFGEAAGRFADRRHFFATAAKAMRHVVIDYARARLAERRGAGAEHVSLEDFHASALPVDAEAEQILGLHAALERLAGLDPRAAQVMELRFFSGLEVSEIAELLELSEPTVKRDTRAAKAFLQRELEAS